MCCSLTEWVTPTVLVKFRPYRKVFVFIAIVSLFFSILIIVENVIFLAVNSNQQAVLLLLPYLLSWILIVLGCLFARFAYILHTRRIKQFASVRPQSPTAWMDGSRPASPIVSEHTLNISCNSAMFRQSLSIQTSPFVISDGVHRYHDEPPNYEDVVQTRASPQPPVQPEAGQVEEV